MHHSEMSRNSKATPLLSASASHLPKKVKVSPTSSKEVPRDASASVGEGPSDSSLWSRYLVVDSALVQLYLSWIKCSFQTVFPRAVAALGIELIDVGRLAILGPPPPGIRICIVRRGKRFLVPVRPQFVVDYPAPAPPNFDMKVFFSNVTLERINVPPKPLIVPRDNCAEDKDYAKFSLEQLQQDMRAAAKLLMPPLRALRSASFVQWQRRAQNESTGRAAPRANLELNIEYKHKGSILSHLMLDLANRHSLFTNIQWRHVLERIAHSPFVHLTSPSGFGKTRAALELGLLIPVIYLMLGKYNGSLQTRTLITINRFLLDGQPKSLHLLHAMVNVILQRIIVLARVYHEEVQRGVLAYFNVDDIVGYICCKYYPNLASESQMDPADDVRDLFVQKILCEGLEHLSALDADDDHFLEPLPGEWSFIAHRSNQHELAERDGSLAGYTAANEAWLDRLASTRAPDVPPGMPKMLIVVDESHLLMKNFAYAVEVNGQPQPAVKAQHDQKTVDTDLYRIYRGAARSYKFYWTHSLVMTISTDAKVDVFYPSPENDPSYKKGRTLKPLEPIVLKGSADAFVPRAVVKNDYSDWLAMLFSVGRAFHISSCGRPLVAVHYGLLLLSHFLEAPQRSEAKGAAQATLALRGDHQPVYVRTFQNNLRPYQTRHADFIQLATAKLSPSHMFHFNTTSCYALLGLSIGVTKFPVSVDISRLVQSYGMCSLAIRAESREIVSTYLSEGVLNGVATVHLAGHFKFVLDTILENFLELYPPFLNQFEFGEFLDRNLLMYSACKSSRRGVVKFLCQQLGTEWMEGLLEGNDERCAEEIVFEPIATRDFLTAAFGGNVADAYLAANPHVADSFIAFNHFFVMGQENVADLHDVVANALARGAAVILRPGSDGADTILPLVLNGPKKRLSHVHIQTKIGASFDDRITFGQIFPSRPERSFKAFYSDVFGKYREEKEIAADTPLSVEQVEEAKTPYIFIQRHMVPYQDEATGKPGNLCQIFRWNERAAPSSLNNNMVSSVRPQQGPARAITVAIPTPEKGHFYPCLAVNGCVVEVMDDAQRSRMHEIVKKFRQPGQQDKILASNRALQHTQCQPLDPSDHSYAENYAVGALHQALTTCFGGGNMGEAVGEALRKNNDRVTVANTTLERLRTDRRRGASSDSEGLMTLDEGSAADEALSEDDRGGK